MTLEHTSMWGFQIVSSIPIWTCHIGTQHQLILLMLYLGSVLWLMADLKKGQSTTHTHTHNLTDAGIFHNWIIPLFMTLWQLWRYCGSASQMTPHVRETLNWHFVLCVAGDGSTYDSLGAALGRTHVGWGSGDMMTIKGELTCECHVKELKRVCFTRVKSERERFLFYFLFMNGAFPLFFFLQSDYSFALSNTAAALVPIKQGKLNWTHRKRERDRERVREKIWSWATLSGEFLAYHCQFKSQGWLHRCAVAQSLTAIIKQLQRAKHERR